MLKTKKVSDVVVKDFKKVKDKRPIKGQSIIEELYANIFACGRKKSGKSLSMKTMIEECATKHTTVIAFVSTWGKDDTWDEIAKFCGKKGIPFVPFQSIKDDNGIDRLQILVSYLQEQFPEAPNSALIRPRKEKEKEEKEPNEGHQIGGIQRLREFVHGPEALKDVKQLQQAEREAKRKAKNEAKKAESKVRSPEYIICLDDLSDELKYKSLPALLKKNRHFKCKVFISSQYPLDLPADARKQIDVWLLWGGLDDDRLDYIRQASGMPLSLEQFSILYHYITKKKNEKDFPFLYYDQLRVQFRRNFTDEQPDWKTINYAELKEKT